MSDSTDYRLAQQYEGNFDPKTYLERVIFHPLTLKEVVKPVLELQHKSFMKHEVSGERVLDVGSGPCVHFSLVPAQHFQEVYLSDYVSKCRQVLTNWKEQPAKAYDVTPLTQHVASLYGNVKPPGFYEDTLRQRMKVLPIDILLDEPLQGQTVETFDCITTSACLEGACSSLEDFEKAVKNLMKYLKPNGYFFHMTCIGDDHYYLGDERIDTLYLTSDQIKQAYAKGGLKPLFYVERSFGNELLESVGGDCAGMAIGLWGRNTEA